MYHVDLSSSSSSLAFFVVRFSFFPFSLFFFFIPSRRATRSAERSTGLESIPLTWRTRGTGTMEHAAAAQCRREHRQELLVRYSYVEAYCLELFEGKRHHAQLCTEPGDTTASARAFSIENFVASRASFGPSTLLPAPSQLPLRPVILSPRFSTNLQLRRAF